MNRTLTALALLAACGGDEPAATDDRDLDGVVDADDPCPDDDDTLPDVHGACPTGVAASVTGPRAGAVLQRDDVDVCVATLTGTLDAGAYAEVTLEVWVDGDRVTTGEAEVGGGAFHVSAPLSAGLVSHELRLRAWDGDAVSAVRTVPDVVCGDLVLINGQSNAVATDYAGEGLANAWQSPWIRSFGTSSTGATVADDVAWRTADGLAQEAPAAIGAWGLRLASEIVARHGVPVGVLNGAVGGTVIAQHQRDDADPENLDTIYGRLLHRARASGVAGSARVVVWYQGESDGGENRPDYVPDDWLAGFTALREDWQTDYPALAHLYVVQVREGCGLDPWNDGAAEVQFVDAAGDWLGEHKLRITPSTGWSRWSTGPVTAPAGAAYAALFLYGLGGAPPVWFDDVAFGPVDGASVVDNGGFEDLAPAPLAPWETGGFVTWEAGGHASAHAVSSWGWESLSQGVPVAAGADYEFEVWARAEEVHPDIREVQRRLPETLPEVTLVSATALPGHDGCHYTTAGYERLAMDLYGLLDRDMYGSTIVDDVQAPSVARAVRVAADVVELEFQPFSGSLALQEGFEASFVVGGARVTGGEVVGGQKLRLQLSGPTEATTISYPGHSGEGGDVVTATGVGILAFVDLAIEAP